MIGLLIEMKILNLEIPVKIFKDTHAYITIAKEPRKYQRLKHIDVKYCFIKEEITSNTFILEYISSSDHLVDILTKGLSGIRYAALRKTGIKIIYLLL